MQENPELEVIPWVDYEVVCDAYGRWQGSLGDVKVTEYAMEKMYGEERIIYKDGIEDFKDYLKSFKEMSDKKASEYINNIKWEKAIFVDVDLP